MLQCLILKTDTVSAAMELIVQDRCQKTFFIKGQIVFYCPLCSYSFLPLWHDSSHRQCVNE